MRFLGFASSGYKTFAIKLRKGFSRYLNLSFLTLLEML